MRRRVLTLRDVTADATARWAVVVLVIAIIGVAGYVRSDAHQLHDPVQALQQLDLLYLDQPAPHPELFEGTDGPVLLVVCQECERPESDSDVVMSDDPDVAVAYGLQTDTGRNGPGYAVIDSAGRVRYRTFDPDPAAHLAEINVLLDGAG